MLDERWEDVNDDCMQNTWQASIQFEKKKRKKHIYRVYCLCKSYLSSEKGALHLKIKVSSAVIVLCLSKLFLKHKIFLIK